MDQKTFFREDMLVQMRLTNSSVGLWVLLKEGGTVVQGEFKPTCHINPMRERGTVDIVVA